MRRTRIVTEVTYMYHVVTLELSRATEVHVTQRSTDRGCMSDREQELVRGRVSREQELVRGRASREQELMRGPC